MKKKLSSFVFLAILLAGCASSPSSTQACDPGFLSTPRPFIVSAFKTEIQALQNQTQVISSCTNSGSTYYLAEYRSHEVILYLSGVGPDQAKISTKSTLKNFKVQILIFSGIAGGLDPDLPIGKTTLVSKWLELGTENTVTIDSNLISLAQKASPSALVVEKGVTSNRFVTNGEQVFTATNASIVDMESFYVAQLAYNHQIPFIAIRTISDKADGQAGNKYYKEASVLSAQAALNFLFSYFYQSPSLP